MRNCKTGRDGLVSTGHLVLRKIPRELRRIYKRLFRTEDINARRLELSKYFSDKFDLEIKYGPLAGYKIPNSSSWGQSDRAAMIFGLYEQEVLESLAQASKHHSVFIDVGAADGYYGVGVVASGMFKQSYCYEISPDGQKVVRASSKENGVDEKVFVHGEAPKTFYKDFSDSQRDDSVILIDIEGGEFDLLDADTFNAFHRSVMFIELHDFFYEDGDDKLARLRKAASRTHRITSITMGSRDLSVFPELATLHDNDRWIICSEGRDRLMTWWRLDPIEPHSPTDPSI